MRARLHRTFFLSLAMVIATTSLAAADRESIGQLVKAMNGKGILVEVPLLPEDVHDVDRLIALGQYLTP